MIIGLDQIIILVLEEMDMDQEEMDIIDQMLDQVEIIRITQVLIQVDKDIIVQMVIDHIILEQDLDNNIMVKDKAM